MSLNPNSTRLAGILAGLMAGAVLAVTGAAIAQDEAQVKAGLALWKSGGCSECHGSFGQGGGGGERPAGPSLRKTSLDAVALAETIACGRPGTAMPMHMAGAYVEAPCYGLPAGEVPRGVSGGGSMTADDIATLVMYLNSWVVGRGDVTREECGYYYDNLDYPLCRRY